jgi:hypothetical protein
MGADVVVVDHGDHLTLRAVSDRGRAWFEEAGIDASHGVTISQRRALDALLRLAAHGLRLSLRDAPRLS